MKNKLVDVVKLSHRECQHPIEAQLAYATCENFIGRIINGYHPNAAHVCLLTRNAAQALCEVQNNLNKNNLGLFVFDSYRPLRAVKDFGQWMHNPTEETHEIARKQIHYPHLEKNQLAELGYVADCVSNHCFGDTIDLSLIDLNTKQLLDMGVCFDYFGELSHPTTPPKEIGAEAYQNRMLLSHAMQQAGFAPYEKEYWHFTYCKRDIETPIDIEITPELEGLGVS